MRATGESFSIYLDSYWSDMNGDSKEHFSHQNASLFSRTSREEADQAATTRRAFLVSNINPVGQHEEMSKKRSRDDGLCRSDYFSPSLPRATNNSQTVPPQFFSSPSLQQGTFNVAGRTDESCATDETKDDDNMVMMEDFAVTGIAELDREQPTAAELVDAVEQLPLFELSELDLDAEGLVADSGSEATRFRTYQSGQWSIRFRELCEYKERTGDCLVPHNYTENLPLARWVKRQRCQYRRMKEGQHSTISEERKQALDEIGFVWDYQGDAWDEKLLELRQYRDKHGNVDVPYHYEENPKLAVWVKCQRRQYKLYMEGKQSSITLDRIDQLESLDFRWGLRSYKKRRVE